MFDPNDPAVKGLEEWEHSPEKSLIIDVSRKVQIF